MAAKRKLRFRSTHFTVLSIIAFIVCMITFPSEAFQASKLGVNAWWNIVFPALLPFFISSELLMGYGVVQFMGVLLEPVMRPLFNLPGAGAFVMAVGFTSGFPISASLAAKLRKEGLCTRLEAERLMCFTNNASPLFMLVAVGVGMFGNPRLGVIIAVAHYTANIIIGIGLRFYGTADPEFTPRLCNNDNLLRRALAEMKRSYRKSPRPPGKMLGDAIVSSMNKLMLIGGFVIIFSVVIKVFSVTGVMGIISASLSFISKPLGFSKSAMEALSFGLFEITLGSKAAAVAAAPLAYRASVTGMILGWSGISVLAQVASMINETDLKMGLFIVSRFVHGLLAGLLTFSLISNSTVTAWLAKPVSTPHPVTAETLFSMSENLLYYTRSCTHAIIACGLLAAVLYLVQTFRIVGFRYRK